MPDDAAATYLLAEARRHDPDRYLCALFAPADRRDALLTLILFDHELARIPEIVTQPMAGMIRLQWWREALDELVAGQAARRHPVVLALESLLMSGAVAPEDLTALIDARESTLEGIPNDMAAVERYAEKTSGSLQRLIYIVLGGGNLTEACAATKIGTGYALARLADAVGGEAMQRRERGSAETIALFRETILGARRRAVALGAGASRASCAPAHGRLPGRQACRCLPRPGASQPERPGSRGPP